jgi:hypothetical protein
MKALIFPMLTSGLKVTKTYWNVWKKKLFAGPYRNAKAIRSKPLPFWGSLEPPCAKE